MFQSVWNLPAVASRRVDACFQPVWCAHLVHPADLHSLKFRLGLLHGRQLPVVFADLMYSYTLCVLLTSLPSKQKPSLENTTSGMARDACTCKASRLYSPDCTYSLIACWPDVA